MSLLRNLTGQRFGRLVALRRVSRDGSDRCRNALWACRCTCGGHTLVSSNHLVRGAIRNCGCLRRQVTAERSSTHGHKRYGTVSRIYTTWCNMTQRCTNRKCPDYPRYGGRGINVCERWRKFANFLKDMGEPPSDRHQIDRINNDQGYRPSNCRWVTPRANRRNTRRNRPLTYKGRSQCLAAWAKETGVKASTIRSRLKAGWPVERALTKPGRNERGGGESNE